MHILQFPDKERLLELPADADVESYVLKLEQALQESKQDATILREELEALVAQMKKIRSYVLEVQQENQFLRSSLDTLQTQYHEKEHEIAQWVQTSTTQERACQLLKEELTTLKEETIQLQDQQTQLRHCLTESQLLAHTTETAHKELQHYCACLQEDLQTTQKELSASKQQHLLLQNEALSLTQDHQNIASALSAFTDGYREKEKEFQIAQQHLAKKVKESAQFSQIQETLQSQITTLETELEKQQNDAQSQASLITTLQETTAQLTSRLNQEMLGAKTQITIWQRDYNQLKEQAQEAQEELKRYRELQERLVTLQRFFRDLSPLLQNSENNPFAPAKESSTASASHLLAQEEAWEFAKGAWRVRQNFFES